MSEGSQELRDLADSLAKVENALAYIAGLENDEDKGRTLADNEVLHRVAQKLRDAADASDEQVDNPDEH